MKKILLLTTGGTIASQQTDGGLAPELDGAGLRHYLGSLPDSYDLTVRDILNLDSSNIQPEEWRYIAHHVYEARKRYDGIVITHGTDTMAYTASMLTFMLHGIEIPVVLTGAQLPISHPLTDGVDNLRTALAMASTGHPGIFLAFDRKIMLGCRAVKTHTTNFKAFTSVNWPLVGTVSGAGLTVYQQALHPVRERCRLRDRLGSNVFLIKLTPGLDPEIFDMLLNMHYRGVVIEAFGAGGLHFIRRNLVEKLRKMTQSGMSVVVCSQCLYESSDFSLYQTGRMALEEGVIEGYDMTTEAAVTKLMWVMGQTEDPEEVRRLFECNMAGERRDD